MLVLCSNGLSSELLMEQMREKTVGCKTAALVVTADNEYKENNYHVQRCKSELEALGLSVDIFDLDKQSAELLLDYDIVEFIGGNPYYLLNSIREHNSADVLKKIAKDKCLIGWSAAVFVFSPTLELVNLYSPEMNFLNLTDLRGIAITPIETLPHYSKFCQRFERFEETCCEYEQEHDTEVIRINDGEGIIIMGDQRIICRI